MNGNGFEEIQKYKITDSEGIDLFLEQNEVADREITNVRHENNGQVISKKKIIVLALSVLIFAITVIAVLIHIQNVRNERIAFNKISDNFNSIISLVKSGESSGFDQTVIYAKLDSALKQFRTNLYKYPGDSRIQNMFTELAVNKYALKWLLQLDQISQSVISVEDEDGELEQAYKYNPDLFFVFKFLEDISYFLQYNSVYTVQPELAAFPPHSWMIDSLSLRGKEISGLLKTNEITLREKFPSVYKYVKYIYNDVYPTIFVWQNFWNQYYQYNDSYDEGEKSRLLRSLQTQFPMLSVINDNFSNKLNATQDFKIGISRTAVFPFGSSTFEKEWNPIIGFLKNKAGLNFSLKIYNTEDELKNEFIDGKVNFALFNNVVSGNLFSSNIGDPLLIRVWNTEIADNVIMITRNKIVKDVSELKGKKVSFSKNAFSAPYLYFYKKNIEPELFFSKVIFAESSHNAIEEVANGFSDVAFVTKENFYYYQHETTNSNLVQNAVITSQPLSILWGSKDLSPEIVQEVISLFSSLDPKILYPDIYPLLHPYGNWVHFGQKFTKQYIKSLCVQSDIDVNSIFLMSMKTKGEIQKDQLMDAVVQSLADKGFVVVDVNSLNLPPSFIKNLDKYTLYINAENNDNNINYSLDFKWELRDTSEILFSRKFTQNAEIFPPNLTVPLSELGNYLPVYAPVKNIINDIVKVKKPRKIDLKNGEIVKFYKIVDKDKNGFRGLFEEFTTVSYGEGKIVSSDNKELTIKVNEQTRKQITTGDYAEIKF